MLLHYLMTYYQHLWSYDLMARYKSIIIIIIIRRRKRLTTVTPVQLYLSWWTLIHKRQQKDHSCDPPTINFFQCSNLGAQRRFLAPCLYLSVCISLYVCVCLYVQFYQWTATGVLLTRAVFSRYTVDIVMSLIIHQPGSVFKLKLFSQTAVHDYSQTRSVDYTVSKKKEATLIFDITSPFCWDILTIFEAPCSGIISAQHDVVYYILTTVVRPLPDMT